MQFLSFYTNTYETATNIRPWVIPHHTTLKTQTFYNIYILFLLWYIVTHTQENNKTFCILCINVINKKKILFFSEMKGE